MAVKQKAVVQHCIRSHFFDEVMRLPNAVKITSIFFEVGFAIKRLSQPVPTALVNRGVTAIRKSDPSVEVDGRVTGSRKKMTADVRTICNALRLNTNTVRVKRMTVQVGKNIGVFHRMQKVVPEGDKMSRKTVLGLVKWEGNENEIAKACNTNKFKCRFDTQVIRTVICEEE